MAYCVYVIRDSKGHRYTGKTNDLERRLRQHNREISGGARATGRGVGWKPVMVISGFETDSEAMQAEWRMKHPRGHRRSRSGDECNDIEIICDTSFGLGFGWTRSSPTPDSQTLVVRILKNKERPRHFPEGWTWEVLPAGADDSSTETQGVLCEPEL